MKYNYWLYYVNRHKMCIWKSFPMACRADCFAMHKEWKQSAHCTGGLQWSWAADFKSVYFNGNLYLL